MSVSRFDSLQDHEFRRDEWAAQEREPKLRCPCCGASDCGECGPYTDATRTIIDDPCRICRKCINHCPHQ